MPQNRINVAFRAAGMAALLVLTAACTPAGVVVGAGAGVSVAAMQERGVDGRARDLRIEAQIFEKFFSTDIDLHGAIGVEVYEGRVLLTGVTENQALADKAVRLVWEVDEVKDVLNEIQTGTGGAKAFVRDSWITGKLRSRITFDKEVLAINYAVETVNGHIYVIGIAQDQKELDRVLAHANNIGYVRDVISHVRVKGVERAAN